MDIKHIGIEFLRIAEKKGMSHEHALNIYRVFESEIMSGMEYGEAIDKLKFSIFSYLYPSTELNEGDKFCDKCDRVIVNGEKCVLKNGGFINWCMGCENKLQEDLAERRRLEAEEKERKRLEEEERKRKFWIRG